ncbi:hypothetical protein Acid345_3308 [Candidatus Koribacter versatilis Ellin345]|uniref:O-antigen polymerase n=1 Tax=Koribacter versatilis (strain Ellin345) TaxID=204669 RepID=Q1ILE1_KORVE|nr:hypothetical protein [Candidatus Koribacter versatilis]ABF42309.1 hypothetical protein Acid345_3308 [Candidatus Koribacter versatilis Ellin345]
MDIRRARILVASAAYIFLLMLMYRTVIAPDFYYMGLWYVPLHGLSFLVTYTCAMLPACWMPLRMRRPSQLSYWVLYFIMFIPAITIPAHALEIHLSDLVPFQLALTMGFFLAGMGQWFRLITFPSFRISPTTFWIVFWLVFLAGYGYIINSTHANFVNGMSAFALGGNEYDLRGVYKKYGESDRLLQYIVDSEASALNTFLVGYGIVRQRWVLSVIGILGELFLFTVTGFRSVLFSTLLLLFVFFQLKRLHRSFALFPISFSAVIIGSRIMDKVAHTASVSSLFLRRLVLEPGLICGWYFEYFNANPKDFFSHSPILKSFTRSVYALPPANQIAAVYFGKPEVSANGNLFADGFAQIGFSGILFFGTALAIYYWVYDCVAKDRDWKIGALMLSVPSITLSNTAFFTALVSHGLILAILVQYFSPRSPDGTQANLETSYELEDEVPEDATVS